MPDVNLFQAQVRFGAYHVDLRTGELRKHGHKIRLAGRPFQILAMLLEQPGELLTRKELQSKLWPADTFVDFEHGVNAAMQTLRRLGPCVSMTSDPVHCADPIHSQSTLLLTRLRCPPGLSSQGKGLGVFAGSR